MIMKGSMIPFALVLVLGFASQISKKCSICVKIIKYCCYQGNIVAMFYPSQVARQLHAALTPSALTTTLQLLTTLSRLTAALTNAAPR